MSGDGTLLDAIVDVVDGRLYDLHTGMPGKVTAYDSATQKATVELLVYFRRQAGGRLVAYKPPHAPGCTVGFLSAGELSITIPIAVGAHGWVMFGERSIDEWKSTGRAGEPVSTRRHALADGVFLPGFRPFSDPIPAAGLHATGMVLRAPSIYLGSSAATDFVALAGLVLAQINALETLFNTHLHAHPVGPTGIPTVLATPTVLADLASTKVRSQ